MCKYITQYIRQTYDPDCPEIWLTYCNIIFNEEIKIYIKGFPPKAFENSSNFSFMRSAETYTSGKLITFLTTTLKCCTLDEKHTF